MRIEMWLQRLASAQRCPTSVCCMLLLWGVVAASPADGTSSVRRVPDEQRLYESIMGRYQQSVMPHSNDSQPLVVAFSLRLNQIVSLNERKQVLTTNVFIDQAWTDPRLKWEPRRFSDVRAMRIPADHVWLPDTFVYNNADGGNSGFMRGTYVQIQSNGRVLWPVPLRLRSSCSVHITYFPFDSQVCLLRFGSWTYGLSKLDYTALKYNLTVDPSSYINNSEWELVSITMNRSILYPAGPGGMGRQGPHPYLSYALHLKRNTFFYLFNIIVPCVMLSTLNVLTFWLPPLSGEKVTLGLSVFLAFSMFMLLIAEEVPASSEAVPLIGVYLCMVMTMTSLSVIMAVVVTNLYHRGRKMRAAPRWLANLCIHWLARPLCVSNDIPLHAAAVDLVEHCQYDVQLRKMSQPPSQQTSIATRASSDLHPDTRLQNLQSHIHHENLQSDTRPQSLESDARHENLPSVHWQIQNGDVTSREAENPDSSGGRRRSWGLLASPDWAPNQLSSRRGTSLAGEGCEKRAGRELHPRARDSVSSSHRFLPAPAFNDDDDKEEEKEQDHVGRGDDDGSHADDEEEEEVWVLRTSGLPLSQPGQQHDDGLANEDDEECDEGCDESRRSLLSDYRSPRFASPLQQHRAGSTAMRSHSIMSGTLSTGVCRPQPSLEQGDSLSRTEPLFGRDLGYHDPNTPLVEGINSLAADTPAPPRRELRRLDTDHRQTHCDSLHVRLEEPGSEEGASDALPSKGGVSSKKLDPQPTSSDLQAMRTLVAEWQQIATVVDRVMFLVYLLSTVIAYVVILLVLPANQPPILVADNITQVGELDFQFKRHDR
ncbi:neuronal acetylcholine receptor subunit alpha-6-like [Pomacea canaliculata]|uniref:neuronal acetylcholine receptor subunit alpha-6-like n=1 Tax=Pomacea canaliculata TaxID=400727 RepID=UPI000D7342D0|nr:neuronal acetylcholine receptor subunit alpha-6-like [Pomacea canaliculata]